jgi:hypothetical protein
MRNLSLLLGVVASSSLSPGCTPKPATNTSPVIAARDVPPPVPASGCNDDAVGDGPRKIALLIGVGEYANPKNNLQGPRNDVRLVNALLTAPGGFGFPSENVCRILDSEATSTRIKAELERLARRVKSDQDEVLIYYSGHGSQVEDLDGDELDSFDETFFVHDSGTPGGQQVLDDDIGRAIDAIHTKTKLITLLVDACHSGTVARGTDDDRARQVPRDPPKLTDEEHEQIIAKAAARKEQVADLVALPDGVVLVVGATDATLSYEPGSIGPGQTLNGYFTGALAQALRRAAGKKATWSQVASQVSADVRVISAGKQEPRFEGAIGRTIFSHGGAADRPLDWEVREYDAANKTVKLVGIPSLGWGNGATAFVYAPSTKLADMSSDVARKAVLKINETDGFEAKATIVEDGRAPIEIGDAVVMMVGAPHTKRLKVQLVTAGAGALSGAAATKIKALVAADPGRAATVAWADDTPDFSVYGRGASGMELRDNLGRLRVSMDYPDADKLAADVVQRLGVFATTRALLSLRPADVGDLAHNKALEVDIVSVKHGAVDAVNLVPACSDEAQDVPVCSYYEVLVRNTTARALKTGAVLTGADGTITTFNSATIPPGVAARLAFPTTSGQPSSKFRATPPFGLDDYVMVFGSTDEDIRWDQLGIPVGAPGAQAKVARVENPGPLAKWTVSHKNLRSVRARDMAKVPREGCQRPKEYTIANFDVTPYLPRDTTAPLRKVLEQADALAKHRGSDGVPYAQHDWSKPTDEANLRIGIDCSRATWFAFKKAGLPYANKDGHTYLRTKDMVGKKSAMSATFDRCDDSPPRIGDLLVYRGIKKGEGVGHVVMVIDPAQHIAWGSHGWDGAAREDAPEDRGVEYQAVGRGRAFAAWDSASMRRVACWRHKAFVAFDDDLAFQCK